MHSESEARAAVERLHDHPQKFLNWARMSVEPVYSRSFETSKNLYQLVEEEVDQRLKESKLESTDMLYKRTDGDSTTLLYLEDQDREYLRKLVEEIEESLDGHVLQGINHRFWDTRLALGGDADMIKLQQDYNVVIHPDHGSREIRLFGPRSKIAEITKWIIRYEGASSLIHALQPISTREYLCVVCRKPSPGVIALGCTHVCCKGQCFERLCNERQRAGVGIRCWGCQVPVSISELQINLSSAAFDSLLERSLDAFVEENHGRYWKCSTFDCGYLYRRSAVHGPVATQTCPGCFAANCTYCRTQHYPMPCGQASAASQTGMLSGGTLHSAQ